MLRVARVLSVQLRLSSCVLGWLSVFRCTVRGVRVLLCAMLWWYNVSAVVGMFGGPLRVVCGWFRVSAVVGWFGGRWSVAMFVCVCCCVFRLCLVRRVLRASRRARRCVPSK